MVCLLFLFRAIRNVPWVADFGIPSIQSSGQIISSDNCGGEYFNEPVNVNKIPSSKCLFDIIWNTAEADLENSQEFRMSLNYN